MTVQTPLYDKHWDYSLHAPYYEYRPNYSPRAIDALIGYMGANPENCKVADIGAGTGNLGLLLLKRGYNVTAVEPNDAMRTIGKNRTAHSSNIEWVVASGTETTLPSNSYDWVTFGSSFSVVNRHEALKETYRILKPGGFFTCIWNHRDLHDPIQLQAETIIEKHVPHYSRGVRREDQRPFLETIAEFKNIFYSEVDFVVNQTMDDYINAWKSVKNNYWDLSTPEGTALFETIMTEICETLPESFCIKYTTRAWTCQRND